MIWTVLGFLAGGYLLLLIGLAVIQRDIIFRPGAKSMTPDEAGLPEMVPVPLKASDGWLVTSWYAPPRDPRGVTIVVFHGNSGIAADRARKARAFLDSGYGVFLAEYRGYGGNPGHPSESGLYADARAILQWLTTRGITQNRIALYGESLGAALATRLAVGHTDLAALVLESPFTSVIHMMPPILLPGLDDLLVSDKFDTLSHIKSVQTPLLIVHGALDTVVPPAMCRELLAAAPGPKEAVFLPDAGHDDVWEQGGDTAALEFLDRCTKV